MPSAADSTAPSAISGMLPVPNSKSQITKTTIAEKMPPISDGIERLRWAWAT